MSTTEKIAKGSTSKSFQKLNPNLFNTGGEDDEEHGLIEALTTERPKKRIRQSAKPLLNNLEKEYADELKRRYGNLNDGFKYQALKLRLGNGVWFCPDIWHPVLQRCWEVKGPHAWEDSLIKLKVVAGLYPEIRFILAWKQDSVWQEQRILP